MEVAKTNVPSYRARDDASDVDTLQYNMGLLV